VINGSVFSFSSFASTSFIVFLCLGRHTQALVHVIHLRWDIGQVIVRLDSVLVFSQALRHLLICSSVRVLHPRSTPKDK
jgi:hypothetical protein